MSNSSGDLALQVGIIGGAGYTGGELIRLLINHPQVEIAFVHSRSNAGKYVHEVHKDLIGETETKFSSSISKGKGWGEVNLLFLCSGHGESKKFLEQTEIPAQVKIIDLSNDFRLARSSRLAALLMVCQS